MNEETNDSLHADGRSPWEQGYPGILEKALYSVLFLWHYQSEKHNQILLIGNGGSKWP